MKEDKKEKNLRLEVGQKVALKLRARKSPTDVWFGLGMMGLIGWSVIVPTLLGAFLGNRLDKKFPGVQSWTLALLIAGLCVGCLNAWYWMSKQHHEIQEDNGNKNE